MCCSSAAGSVSWGASCRKLREPTRWTPAHRSSPKKRQPISHAHAHCTHRPLLTIHHSATALTTVHCCHSSHPPLWPSTTCGISTPLSLTTPFSQRPTLLQAPLLSLSAAILITSIITFLINMTIPFYGNALLMLSLAAAACVAIGGMRHPERFVRMRTFITQRVSQRYLLPMLLCTIGLFFVGVVVSYVARSEAIDLDHVANGTTL